jgi:hypothetical protein
MTAPTMFTDTPEDLIASAKQVAQSGRIKSSQGMDGVTQPACLLLGELAKSLEVERASRASQYSALRAQNIYAGEAEAALKRARTLNKLLGLVIVLLMVTDAILVAHR